MGNIDSLTFVMNPIDELKRQLTESWKATSPSKSPRRVASEAVSLRNEVQNNSDEISSLAENLSNQMDYNNSLLVHVENLENKLAHLQREYREVNAENSRLRKSLQEVVSANTEMQRKLDISLQSSNNLTDQCTQLRDEATHYQVEFESLQHEHEKCSHQNHLLVSENEHMKHSIHELENSLQWLKHSQLEATKEGSFANNRLRESLQQTTNELETIRRSQLTIETELTERRDENIRLQRGTERLLRQVQEETFAKETLLKNNKLISHENTELTERVQQGQLRIVELEERDNHLSAEIREWREANKELNKQYQHLEQIHRRSEESVRQLSQEYSSLKELFNKLQQEQEHSLINFSQFENEVKERERISKSQFSDAISSAQQQIEELSNLLQKASEQLQKERKKYEEITQSLNNQIEELHRMLRETRVEHDNRLSEVSTSRNATLHKVEQLEATLVDLEKDSLVKLAAENEKLQLEIAAKNALKAELSRRGDHYVSTLTNIQKVLHELVKESKEQQSKQHVVAVQHAKLCTILKQLSSRTVDSPTNHVNELASSTSAITPRSHSPSKLSSSQYQPVHHHNNSSNSNVSPRASSCRVLKPLFQYGFEVSSAIHLLGNKTSDLLYKEQQLLHNLLAKTDEIKDVTARAEQADSDREAALREISLYRHKLGVVEAENANLQRHAATLQENAASQQQTNITIIAEWEEKTNHLTNQNMILQGDLSRLSSDLTYIQSSYETKLGEHVEKIKSNDKTIESQKKDLKNLGDKCSGLQAELIAAESNYTALQAEFQQLRQSCSTVADMATKEKKKHQQQIASLGEAMAKYQQQLQQNHQLMNAIQSHRKELMEEISVLKEQQQQQQQQHGSIDMLNSNANTNIGSARTSSATSPRYAQSSVNHPSSARSNTSNYSSNYNNNNTSRSNSPMNSARNNTNNKSSSNSSSVASPKYKASFNMSNNFSNTTNNNSSSNINSNSNRFNVSSVMNVSTKPSPIIIGSNISPRMYQSSANPTPLSITSTATGISSTRNSFSSRNDDVNEVNNFNLDEAELFMRKIDEKVSSKYNPISRDQPRQSSEQVVPPSNESEETQRETVRRAVKQPPPPVPPIAIQQQQQLQQQQQQQQQVQHQKPNKAAVSYTNVTIPSNHNANATVDIHNIELPLSSQPMTPDDLNNNYNIHPPMPPTMVQQMFEQRHESLLPRQVSLPTPPSPPTPPNTARHKVVEEVEEDEVDDRAMDESQREVNHFDVHFEEAFDVVEEDDGMLASNKMSSKYHPISRVAVVNTDGNLDDDVDNDDGSTSSNSDYYRQDNTAHNDAKNSKYFLSSPKSSARAGSTSNLYSLLAESGNKLDELIANSGNKNYDDLLNVEDDALVDNQLINADLKYLLDALKTVDNSTQNTKFASNTSPKSASAPVEEAPISTRNNPFRNTNNL